MVVESRASTVSDKLHSERFVAVEVAGRANQNLGESGVDPPVAMPVSVA